MPSEAMPAVSRSERSVSEVSQEFLGKDKEFSVTVKRYILRKSSGAKQLQN